MVNEKRITRILLELIKIDSPSGEEDKIAFELKERFENLGARVAMDNFGNVVAKFDGEGEPVLLSAHMDTVEPGRNIEPVIKDGVVTSAGETVLGSDPKAGIAAILEALTLAKEQRIKTVPIEVVLTRDEERGSTGVKNLDWSSLSSKRAVVFDGDGPVYLVNHAAPGYCSYDVIITGRAAHAGLEPEKGISSIKIATEIINRLPLGRIDEETTTNVGLISGGSARNAVPEKTEIKGEARSRDPKKLDVQVNKFKAVIEEVEGLYPEAKINYELEKKFEGFNILEGDPLRERVSVVCKKLGMEAKFEPTGGGSDANFFNERGITAVVVGTGVRELHTTKESLTISEMVGATEFCLELVKT